MMTDEYVTASDLKAIEQRVNREAQQTMQHLMTLQGRIDMLQSLFNALEEKDQYKERSPQSVADFERSQSLNALSQKPTTNRDIDYEAVTKAAQQYNADWTDWNPVSDRIRIQAFKAGAKWAQSKPLPNQTL